MKIISLWQLAEFRCDSWPNFIVAVGRTLLWQLAEFVLSLFAL